MSVFIDPDTLQPFYGGTYFPREPMQGRPSFTQLLEGIAEAWTTQRPAIKQQGEMIGQRLEQRTVGVEHRPNRHELHGKREGNNGPAVENPRR